jgi:uncharacterized protein YeaO (DUF488 family)
VERTRSGWLAGASPALAAWYRNDPSRWQEFRIQYLAELRGNPHLRRLTEAAERSPVTLLASGDAQRSPAEVLRSLLRGR